MPSFSRMLLTSSPPVRAQPSSSTVSALDSAAPRTALLARRAGRSLSRACALAASTTHSNAVRVPRQRRDEGPRASQQALAPLQKCCFAARRGGGGSAPANQRSGATGNPACAARGGCSSVSLFVEACLLRPLSPTLSPTRRRRPDPLVGSATRCSDHARGALLDASLASARAGACVTMATKQ